MGANAQTSVPLFVANSVLTAAQQNISAATGVPVFATTVTRDAAFGGSNKVLAEGQLCYIEASDVVQYYTGAAWATVGPATAGALTLINAGSFSAAATASLPTGSFSSTYKNYKVIYQLSAVSGANALRMRFRAAGADNTASNYDFAEYGRRYGAATAIVNESVAADNFYLGNSISYSALSIDVLTPQATAQTILFSSVNGNDTTADGAFQYNARFTATTSFDAMTLYVSAGTITGTFRVYGYGDS
jgi:hypothetical protein